MNSLHLHLSEKKPGEFLPVNASMLNLTPEAFHRVASAWQQYGGQGFSVHRLNAGGTPGSELINEAVLVKQA